MSRSFDRTGPLIGRSAEDPGGREGGTDDADGSRIVAGSSGSKCGADGGEDAEPFDVAYT